MSEAAREAIGNTPWEDIRRRRILLAHHYHRIDPDHVRSIAPRDVPVLVTSILGARPDLQI